MASNKREPRAFTLITLCVMAAVAMVTLISPAHGIRAIKMTPSNKTVALLMIDVQDCFLPGGSLAVPQGEEVVPVINRIRHDFDDQFSLVVRTKDYHCDRHVSFASSHAGKKPFEEVTLRYMDNGTLCLGDTITPLNFPQALSCPPDSGKEIVQKLWPDHCVRMVDSGPTSSDISSQLYRKSDDVTITKGTNCQIDYYSAIFDIGRFGMTDLYNILDLARIDTLIVVGLALDYCVRYTAIDGRYLGYDVYVIQDATRGVAADTTTEALREMEERRVHIINSANIHDVLFKVSITGTGATDRTESQFDAAPRISTLSLVVLVAWTSVFLMMP